MTGKGHKKGCCTKRENFVQQPFFFIVFMR